MALRPCLGYQGYPHCPRLTTTARCATCQAEHARQYEATRTQRGRPTPQARGYDADHRRQRAALKATLPAPCWAGCGRWLEPDGNWVAAHLIDGDPTSPRVATCRSCNEKMKRNRDQRDDRRR